MFSIIHDLMNKRARILGIHTAGADVQVTAAVSEAALIDYAGRLHAITAGQGSYTVTAEPSGE